MATTKPDKTHSLHVTLAERHLRQLNRMATERNLDLESLVQRMIQERIDKDLALPTTLSRQVGSLVAKLVRLKQELHDARRAYESSEGSNPQIGIVLKQSLDKVNKLFHETERLVRSV